MSRCRRSPVVEWLAGVRSLPHPRHLPPIGSPPHPHSSRNTTLSRENHPDPSPVRAHPRHRLAEGRARLAEACEWPSGRARAMTRLRTGDVCPDRQVFVTDSSMCGAGDTFNSPSGVFGRGAPDFSRPAGTALRGAPAEAGGR